MTRYFIRRLIRSFVIFLAAATLIFLMIRLAPGDPARLYLGIDATPAAIAHERAALGLDRSLPAQYGTFMGDLFQAKLGSSVSNGESVWSLVMAAAPPTIELALLAVAGSSILAIALGLTAAAHRGGARDTAIRVGTVIGISIPNFWLGLVLVLTFGLWIPGIFPSSGWVTFSSDPWQNILHAILPAIVLGLPNLAIVTRTLRVSMIESLDSDYVRFGRSRGLSERRLRRSLALPNAVIPTTTVIGLAVGLLISGTVIVENVFSIPGVGRLMVNSFQQKDYPVAIGSTLFMAFAFILVNLIVDVLYAVLNPRIKELYASGGLVGA
jgi:peptide/nickel transport system permease protein